MSRLKIKICVKIYIKTFQDEKMFIFQKTMTNTTRWLIFTTLSIARLDSPNITNNLFYRSPEDVKVKFTKNLQHSVLVPSKGTFGWKICLEPFLGCFLLSTLELYKPHEWASGFRFGQVNLSWGMCERNVAELIPYSYSSSYSPELCKKNATALTTLELTPRHGAVRHDAGGP